MRENGSLLEEGRKERREEVFPTIPPHPTSIIHHVLAFKFFFEFRIKSPKKTQKKRLHRFPNILPQRKF